LQLPARQEVEAYLAMNEDDVDAAVEDWKADTSWEEA
jgi:limonene-1,2-epoxide hydrolase